MKKSLPILFILLSSCISYTRELKEHPIYSDFVGRRAVTTKVLYLNKMDKHLYAFFPHEICRFPAVSYEGKLVKKLGEGTEVLFTKAGRERALDGHSWDYLIGVLRLEGDKDIPFEYMIGLANSGKPIPFKVLSR